MKKQALSWLLAMALTLGLLPGAALGAESPSPADRTALMDAIAAKLSGSSDGWAVLDMAVYATLEGKSAATTPEARQEALDLLAVEAAGDRVTVSDRARLELVLGAMGVDSTRLRVPGGDAWLNNAQALSQMDLTSAGHYAVPGSSWPPSRAT